MLDFVALCRDKNIPLIQSGHHHTHQGWAQTHCPFCAGGSHGWHLGFNLDKGNFSCWRCGGHGVWDTIGRILHITNKGELAELLKKYDHRGNRTIHKVKPRKKSIKAPPNVATMNGAHRQYLRKRGFCPEIIEREWGLAGTSHLSGKWNWRIIIPVHNLEGDIVAYCGRSIDDDTRPKYRMSENEDILVEPRSLLYGLHKAQGDSVAIVEGPTDAWRLGPGAVATLGIDWKVEQAIQLKKFRNRFIIYDPEKEAQEQAQKLAEWLSVFSGNTEVIEGLGCDPGALTPQEAEKVMKELGFSGKVLASRRVS